MKVWPIVSYAFGAVVGFVIFTVLTLTLKIMPLSTVWVNMLIALGMTAGVIMTGFRKVAVVHEAVVTFLGARMPVALTEGWVWILPWFMDLIEVNVQERSITIGDDGKLQAIAIDKELTPSEERAGKTRILTERSVELTIKMLVRYRIENVCQFLNLEESRLEKNIVEAAKSSMREYVSKHDFLVIMSGKDEAGSCIWESFEEEVGPLAKSWGVKILGLTLARVVPANKSLVEAMEKEAREQAEGEGEQKEMDNVIKQVKRLATELGISTEKARQLYQSERGKAKVVIYEGLEKAGGIQIQAE